MKNRIFYTSIVIFVVILIFPVLEIFQSVRDTWRGVTPGFSDSVYYYARMKEVVDGNPLIGNPFLLEHSKEVAPAFFVSDWIAAAPLFFGFSLTITVVFNTVIWSSVFILFLYLFMRQVGILREISSIISIFGYLCVYTFMVRAVSMQVIFPFFSFFLFALIYWYKKPESKKNMFMLILATSFSFYIYTYLWQITFVALILAICLLFIQREKIKAFQLTSVLFVSMVFGLPMFVFTTIQIKNPFYWESMERIGLVNSHLPTANVIYSFFMVFAMIFLWYLLRHQVIKKLKDVFFERAYFIVIILGLALCITSSSNIITGKELENSQHIERFIAVWFVCTLGMFIFFAYSYRKYLYVLSRKYKTLLIVFFLITSIGLINYFKQYSQYFLVIEELTSQAINLQKYAPPINWLDDNENNPSVVWTDSPYLLQYLPIMTKHYLLFTPGTSHLHLLSNHELEKRYLAYHYFDNLTIEDIENQYWSFAGVGNAIHQYKTYNRTIKVCKVLKLDLLGVNCGTLKDAVSYKGKAFFVNLHDQYRLNVSKNIIQELNKYKVRYAIKDKVYQSSFRPDLLPFFIKVYEDNDFSIYRLK
ncbi:MAG: hypothetical protein EXS50_00200 [Candidatus Taylorbacteria bacterium]|nr:hypothetical protein [Candidatus Taylorbacteria bacterium]